VPAALFYLEPPRSPAAPGQGRASRYALVLRRPTAPLLYALVGFEGLFLWGGFTYIGALAVDGKKFDYKTNERLHKALELKLFEDQKDSIKLTSLVSKVIDKDTQAKIDVVKSRLIRDFGYDDESATDVLNYVASIFARGDVKRK